METIRSESKNPRQTINAMDLMRLFFFMLQEQMEMCKKVYLMVSGVLFFLSFLRGKNTKKLITALQNNSWNTANITDWHLRV